MLTGIYINKVNIYKTWRGSRFSQLLRTHLQTACHSRRYPAVATPSVHALNWLVVQPRRNVFTARYELNLFIQVNLGPVWIAGHAICDMWRTDCRVFSQCLDFPPVRIIPYIPHTPTRPCVHLTRPSNYRSLETVQKSSGRSEIWAHWMETYEGAPLGPFLYPCFFQVELLNQARNEITQVFTVPIELSYPIFCVHRYCTFFLCLLDRASSW